ncbi:DUF4293 domain-containing protein [Ravibacter arvi]|uniref:DUF4293 domain-containing protein n=1 Tax=Ravibacter arvi TaxID=2051041 RepID=A0ABP8LXI0_9BACT
MIQRIQSVFLLIVALAMGAFIGLPVWHKTATNGEQSISLDAFTIRHQLNSVQAEVEPVYYHLILAVLIAGVALFALFKYRNRLLQSALCAVNSILMTVLLASVVYQTMFRAGKLFDPESKGEYEYGFYALVISMLANVLANRFIRRDEKLVKESNRFR